MKRVCFMLILLTISFMFISCVRAENIQIKCEFDFPEDSAQIGKPFSFSYSLSGGSGNYTEIIIDAEFVTVHEGAGYYVDSQQMIIGATPSGTVTFTPVAGTAIILWLRGYDAVTQESFYFECHQGWVSVEPNPDILVTFQRLFDEAVVGEQLSMTYDIESDVELSEIKTWWQVGGDGISSEHCEEHNLSSLSGTLSFIPLYGDYTFVIIQGKTIEGDSFYAESERVSLIYSADIEKISCVCSFPENKPQIGEPYTFSYALAGGSGSFSNIAVGAEFVTQHDNAGRNVDYQKIELGDESAGSVTFIPKAGSAIILWLWGKDATTQQSFYFECHEGGWLSVLPNSNYPVTFSFERNDYVVGDNIQVDYEISNLPNNILIDGKLWWLLVADYEYKDHLDTVMVSETPGTAAITPTYGTCIYAVLEGKDSAGNPIYAESEHLQLGSQEEITNVFVLPSSLQSIGEEAFYDTKVQKVIMPVTLRVQGIADDAFQNTSLKVIAGDSEDAKTYALEHGFLYEEIGN